MNLALVKKLWKTMQMDKAIGEGAALSWVQFLEMAFKDMPEPPSLGVSDEEAQEIVDWWNSKPFTQPAKANEVIATVEERVEAANKTPMPSKQEFQSQVPASVSAIISAGQIAVGFSVSTTTILILHIAVLFPGSVTVTETAVKPTPNEEPEGIDSTTVVAQLSEIVYSVS